MASTSTGILPTAWVASVWKTMPCSLASLPISAMGWIVPISLLANMTEIRMVLSVIAALSAVDVHQPFPAHGQVGDLEALTLEPLADVQAGALLDDRGHDVIALLAVHLRHALEGQVDGLGPARGEDDLLRVAGADQRGDLLTRLVHAGLRLPAEGVVAARRVAELLGEVRAASPRAPGDPSGVVDWLSMKMGSLGAIVSFSYVVETSSVTGTKPSEASSARRHRVEEHG